MKDIELPPLPRRSLCEFDGAVEIDLYTKEQMQAYARAAVEADRAQRVVPDTLCDDDLSDLAHSANQEALSFGLSHDVFLRYFKEVRRRLLASTPAPAQQEPVYCTYPACQSTGKTCLGACAKHAAHHQAPPQQERKPMTPEQVAETVFEVNGNEPSALFWRDLVSAVERHHRIKE